MMCKCLSFKPFYRGGLFRAYERASTNKNPTPTLMIVLLNKSSSLNCYRIKVLDAEYEAQNNAEIIAITDEERSSMEKLDRERHARHNFLKKCLKKSK